MTTIDAANAANVEASLNAAFKAAITAFTRPAWLPTLPAFKFNWEEVAASLPCFASAFLGENTPSLFQGEHVGNSKRGQRRDGLWEVSCFVSRADTSWSPQLRTMRAMVDQFVLGTTSVLVRDYITNPASPSLSGYKIDLYGVEQVPTLPDPNENVLRARLIIRYGYTARA